MYERFTDRARKVMQLANQEALRFNHEYIGTEHILLGLVQDGSGVAATVLKNLDINLLKVRQEVEKIIQSGPDLLTQRSLPQTPRAKKVIEYAIEEARKLNHNYVGTEHLLLGLLREEEGVAALVLMNFGLKLEDVREETMRVLGQEPKVREEYQRRAEIPHELDALVLFKFLPEEFLLSIKDIALRIEKVVQENEAAVERQDFEKAARCREKADRIRRQSIELILQLHGSI